MAQQDVIRVVSDEPSPDISPNDLPCGLAREMLVPTSVEEAVFGPHGKKWKAMAMRGIWGGISRSDRSSL